MKLCARWAILYLFSASLCLAHDVSGTIEVLLKGDKKKADLSTVVVYLDDMKPPAPPQASQQKKELTKEFTMETRNKQFGPRLLAVPLGAKIDFPNFDPIFHNLFSVSRPNDFDLGLFKGGTSKSKTFESAGVVRVYCNVHPQMTATIIVANSPFFTTADKSGNFVLGSVPSGSYMLRAYTDEGQAEQKVDVGENPLKVKLAIDARGFKKIKHKNKLGKDYPTDANERY